MNAKERPSERATLSAALYTLDMETGQLLHEDGITYAHNFIYVYVRTYDAYDIFQVIVFWNPDYPKELDNFGRSAAFL